MIIYKKSYSIKSLKCLYFFISEYIAEKHIAVSFLEIFEVLFMSFSMQVF